MAVRMIKRDDALWLRHLREAGLAVPPGVSVVLRIEGDDVEFEPMRPSFNGRPTLGLRATGSARNIWIAIPKGSSIGVELVRLSEAPVRDERAHGGGHYDSRPHGRGAPLRPTTGIDATAAESVETPSGTTAFDAYLMVDWSACKSPKTGADSIWWCLSEWDSRTLQVRHTANPPTRLAAFDSIRSTLRELAREGKRVLVGFDFPYGYPTGLARALGAEGAAWRAVWHELGRAIQDDQLAKVNNRFSLADDWNDRIGAEEGPFWGHPQGRSFQHLRPTAPAFPVNDLENLRLAERWARSAQPVWKLYGNGSVGSQALLGIPYVARLRGDERLREISAVWPFETGCELPIREGGVQIVHAEIYPSIVKLPEDLGSRVKDCVQVELMASHFAKHDAQGTLHSLFEAPANLPPADAARVVTEEGWILGLTLTA